MAWCSDLTTSAAGGMMLTGDATGISSRAKTAKSILTMDEQAPSLSADEIVL